jgi:ketosteroid isomerase-like protein
MKTTHTLAVMLGALLLFGQANAGDDTKVAAEVMALARAQWDAEVSGKSVAEQMASTADDYTEFNPDYPVRLDGKVSPNKAKSTRVYSKIGDKWMLVHANFAPVD